MKVGTVERIGMLAYDEGVRLDQERIEDLYRRMGDAGAEDVVCRALEEIAVRMSYANKLHKRGDLAEMRKCLRSLSRIADQIGMVALSSVARDVCACIDQNDAVAMAATLSRLARTGDRSLTAIWDLQEFMM
ncbi:hypothetical protein [Marinovum algicola]|uniref:Uncharacterized protein n=2 Tax=Roseobacteraceae TaxID=2854170 RepID=A0A975ZMS6_9RHOB|nr:hypothetical protein [Marinovum algicola]AKO98272.1 hypothetical protein MALG_03127 [Marinovum algicola DG 898]SEJ20733.1 hypothetical protein SAMN04487940_10453 [Marinovum algicola]SLN75599.1 hypothetical protein MAA5396_04520 [Marinovum algicola]